MEIRDVIHGSIPIDREEIPVLDSRLFQRLRQIKQLGFTENSFPAATHTRYIHSLGAMQTATQAFDTLFGGPSARESQYDPDRLKLFEKVPAAFARFRSVLRMAALLHDVGHGPLSHTTEFAMPDVEKLHVPGSSASGRKATHEDYTLKIILDSPLTPAIQNLGRRHGFEPRHVAALIDRSLPLSDDFFKESLDGKTWDFLPVLQQLVSSELDCDRMDYLRRDSWHTGVSYGQFDFDWLLGNLTTHRTQGKVFLALQHRALYAFEDFLLSRFHMFLMVYFHYKSVVLDEMLARYFASPDCDYALPADIEAYGECNDSHLAAHLARRTHNPWAKRITDRRPYRMLVELHSGIPTGRSAAEQQRQLLERLEAELAQRQVDYLKATSSSELSKYFAGSSPKSGDPLFVRYDNFCSDPQYIPLEKCTDLFEKYGEKRSITRLYVAPEKLPELRDLGRGRPLTEEEPA
jgi:hypothetical protein